MTLVCVIDAYIDFHEQTHDHTLNDIEELCGKVYSQFGDDISEILEENILTVVHWRVTERLQLKLLCEIAATTESAAKVVADAYDRSSKVATDDIIKSITK